MPSYSVQHTWHPDVMNLAKRVRLAGGTLNAVPAKALSEFAHYCYVNGLRNSANPASSLIQQVWIPATAGFAGSLECLWHPPAIGSAVANTGFVAGDYALVSGFTSNGTSKYISTGFIPNAHLSGFDIHFGFYCRTATAINEAWGCDGTSGGNNSLRVFPKFTNDTTIAQFGGASVSSGTAAPLGLLNFSMTSNNYAVWLKTTKIGTQGSNPPAGVSGLNQSVHLFTYIGSGGSVTAIGARSCGGSTIGRGLSDTQAPIYATAWQTLQTALGRAV